MKNILYLVGLFLPSMLAGLGQTGIPTFQYVNVAPSGTCPGITPPIQIVYATGLAYSCQVGVWGPFAGTGASGATLPTDAIVYGLSPTTSRAAVAGADYISPTITNGMSQVGTAITGTNYNSNVFALYGDYCTGSPCAPAQDYYTLQNVVGTGVNPTTTLNVSHFGSSGASSAAFNFPVSLATGSTAVTQTTGDNTTKLATDAFVLANQTPGGVTSVFGRTGAVTSSSGDYSVGQVTGAAPLASPTFTGVPAGPTATVGTDTTQLATTAFVLANAGGNPGGSNTQVQYNNSSAFGGDATFTFNNSTKTLGFQNGTTGPLGTAISGTNYNSGISQVCGSYWNGTAAAPDCWNLQDIPGTGTNPYTELSFVHAGSSGGGQMVFPFTSFTNGFGLYAINNSGSVLVGPPLDMPSGNYQVNFPELAPSGSNDYLSCPLDSGTLYTCVWSAGGGGGSGLAITPQQLGGYGDAYSVLDGCSTTASNTTITCSDGPFVSGDVGKQIWVQGAGAAGVAFNATISSVTSSTAVVASAAPSTSVTAAVENTVYGHDDVTAVQACFQYSASHQIPCVLVPVANPPGIGNQGFLIGSGGLQLVPNNAALENAGESVIGNSAVKGTNLFCEFNGDCLSLAAGGIQGVVMDRLEFLMDPTQPSSRAMNFTPSAGIYGGGELTTSTFSNIEIDNPALECLFMNGGGGPGYTYNMPNQILNFFMFQCNGPNQSHPASLIKMQGQAAQILFENGQVNGLGVSNYPNYLIDIDEKTSGLGDTPVDVKFFGYTFEVGQKGLYAGNGSNDIHFDNGYVEDVTNTVFSLYNSPGFTFNGNHIASSAYAGGAVGIGQLTGGSTASIRDNWVYGNAPAALAVCSGSGNSIDFAGDVVQAEPTNLLTTNCATATATTTGGALILGQGATTASISCSGAAISDLAAPGVQPGKTLTMYAPASGCVFTTGGNIAFGNFISPVTVPAGGSITMTLLDSGVTFLVTDAPAASSFSGLTAGANTDTGAFSTNGPWTFHKNVYIGTGSPATFTDVGAIAPSAYDQFTTNQIGGTCSMSTGTTCTITIGNTYVAPVCIATEQGTSATVTAAACDVTGTTVTITAAVANSATWGAFVFGNSH